MLPPLPVIRRAYYPNPDGSREDALVLRWQAMPA